MQQKKNSLGYVCKQENNEANLVEICLLALRWIYLPIDAGSYMQCAFEKCVKMPICIFFFCCYWHFAGQRQWRPRLAVLHNICYFHVDAMGVTKSITFDSLMNLIII